MSESRKVPIELRKILDNHDLFQKEHTPTSSFAEKLQVTGE